jgi:hypothetical protein
MNKTLEPDALTKVFGLLHADQLLSRERPAFNIRRSSADAQATQRPVE